MILLDPFCMSSPQPTQYLSSVSAIDLEHVSSIIIGFIEKLKGRTFIIIRHMYVTKMQQLSIKRSDWWHQNLDVRHKSLMLMSPDPFPSLGLVRVAATPD